MEHKHAEVLRAIADGKEVEWRLNYELPWTAADNINPLSYPKYEWRIKPEPKPPIVTEVKIWMGDANSVLLRYNRASLFVDDANIRFTFDPDTKLPIKVELI